MRYQIIVNGRLLVETRYITDMEWFIGDRISLGMTVEVRCKASGRTWINPTVGEIMDWVFAGTGT